MLYLFLGGSKDGEHIEVEDKREYYNVAVLTDPISIGICQPEMTTSSRITTELYIRCELLHRDTNTKSAVYTYKDKWTLSKVLRYLIVGYTNKRSG